MIPPSGAKVVNLYVMRQKGFAAVIVILLVVTALTIAVFIAKNGSNPNSSLTKGRLDNQEPTRVVETEQSTQSETNPYLGVPCVSSPHPIFSHDFTDAEMIQKVTPPSLVASKAQDRAFLWIDQSKTTKVPIYAPVDTDLIRGIYKMRTTEGKETIDYDLHFQVSCEIWFFINHISDPVDKIKNFFPKIPAANTTSENYTKILPPLHLSAGDLIGYTTGTIQAKNFDFGVFDLHNTNKLVGEVKSNDSRFNNFICPFDVFSEKIKKSYYQKLIPELIPESNCKK